MMKNVSYLMSSLVLVLLTILAMFLLLGSSSYSPV
jgi:hypothetical protein